MAYLEIVGNGNSAYDNTYEGILFKKDNIADLSFTKNGSDLVITGKLDGADFTYTITNYDFTSSTISNLNNLYKGATSETSIGTISNDYKIVYTLTAGETFNAGSYKYNFSITIPSGTTWTGGNPIITRFKSGDILKIEDFDNYTFHASGIHWPDDQRAKLWIKDGSDTILEIQDFGSNQANYGLDVSDKTLYVNDAIEYDASSYGMGFGNIDITVTERASIPIISGGNRNDTIRRYNHPYADNIMNGRAGDDTLYGYLGNDTLSGDEGNDIIYGAEDDDTLNGGEGNDTLSGGSGSDKFHFNNDFGNDIITDSQRADALYFDGINRTDISFNSETGVITVGINTVTLQGYNTETSVDTYYVNNEAGVQQAYSLTDLMADTDKVAVKWNLTGTHDGEFMGIAPTNKKISVCVINFYYFNKEGKVTNDIAAEGMIGIFHGIGAM